MTSSLPSRVPDLDVAREGSDDVIFHGLQFPGRELSPVVDQDKMQTLAGGDGAPVAAAGKSLKEAHASPPGRTSRAIRPKKPSLDSRASKGTSSPLRRRATSRNAFPARLPGSKAA